VIGRGRVLSVLCWRKSQSTYGWGLQSFSGGVPRVVIASEVRRSSPSNPMLALLPKAKQLFIVLILFGPAFANH